MTSGSIKEAILRKRGIGAGELESFLRPDYERDMHDPYLMRDMENAVERVHRAVKENEKVVVYADYDCDGIPGAVILHDFFKKIGFQNFEVYIPDRHAEGYGLNIEAVEIIARGGAKLLITIDLGITAVEEISLANNLGMEVIIIDHHIPPENGLPQAYAILNPKVDDYPEKMLCGAGVAFKFVQGFLKKYGEEFKVLAGWEKWLLDMAGLATLADMVPLLGENRAMAHFGLKVLRKSPRPGFQKLLAKAGVEQKYLTEDDVGFTIAPRINAASRIDEPMRAFELLSATDAGQGGALAEHLTKVNDHRKHLVLNIMKSVKKKFESREVGDVVVIGNPDWRIGVLGLVAGKIMDEYGKTVFVWGKDENDKIRGSCRSDGAVSVVELMREAGEFFDECGGHESAGGFTANSEKIHFLEEELNKIFQKVKKENTEEKEGEVMHDLELGLSMVSRENWRVIAELAPYGVGNPKPVFLFPKVLAKSARSFGKNGGEHLEVVVEDSSGKSKAISFFSGLDSFSKKIEEGRQVNLVATFDLSRFRGREELRLRIIDII